jgi:uncharacterized protein YcbK (DUF882 family)
MAHLLKAPLSRRSLLKKALAGGSAALLLPWLAPVPAKARTAAEAVTGRISVTNAHTDESLRIRYLEKDGSFIPDALYRLNYLFRCHYDGEIKPIDPTLFVLMDRIHTVLGAGKRPLVLISGYRSQEYNRLLRSRGRGVAQQSYHLEGMAADIQIPGISLKKIRQTAVELAQGGVGSYRLFIHVDLGPVRTW